MTTIRATIIAVLLTFASGCIVTGRATVRTRTPDMVYVSDNVYVIEDYDEPVFYSEGAYWRYYGGVWYSSSYYSGGWVRVRSVPVYVSRINNPHTYVHYRGHGSVKRQKVRDHRGNSGHHKAKKENKRPKTRDHRR